MFGAQLRLLGDDSKVIHLLKKYFYEVIVTMQGRKIKYFDTKVKTTILYLEVLIQTQDDGI